MRYFIQERKTCYIEADNEEEVLHKYYKGETDDVESDVEIEESLVTKS